MTTWYSPPIEEDEEQLLIDTLMGCLEQMDIQDMLYLYSILQANLDSYFGINGETLQ